MPQVYFAKFNINEKIYEVYKNEKLLSELLNKVFRGMNTDIELIEEKKEVILRYKFITLDKNPNNFIVNGRLVAYAPGTNVSYDDEKDDIVHSHDKKKASYVTFSFDTRREIVGFVPKGTFGRNQFIERFKCLIEKSVPEIGEINLELEHDAQKVQSRMAEFSHIQELEINLIPPNNDKLLFQKLYGMSSDELGETGGTKFSFRIKGTAVKGVNKASKFVRNLVNGVILGYGNIRVQGKNTTGEPLRIDSSEKALYTKGIEENNKDSIPAIAEKTRSGYLILAQSKLEAKEELLKEKDDLKIKLLEKIDHEAGGEEK